jgi:hypothetical protein
MKTKGPLAQSVRLTNRWHDTRLEEEGDSGYEGEDRIYDGCIDVAYNIEGHVLRPTSCDDREDEQGQVQDPKQYCHLFREDIGGRADG